MRDRQYSTDSDREWVCPECGHRETRHHRTKTRPFCDPCDWQHAVLIEMVPYHNDRKVALEA